MHKHNTKLHQSIHEPEPKMFAINWHEILGALFLLVVSMALIALIYSWETGKELQNTNTQAPGHACVQVITKAQNPTTGEIQDFNTPCEVPSTWIKLDE